MVSGKGGGEGGGREREEAGRGRRRQVSSMVQIVYSISHIAYSI